MARENERAVTRLRAGFNPEGDLVLEGYDTGSLVEQVWGRDEYEYWLTVKKATLPHLAREACSPDQPVMPDGRSTASNLYQGCAPKAFFR